MMSLSLLRTLFLVVLVMSLAIALARVSWSLVELVDSNSGTMSGERLSVNAAAIRAGGAAASPLDLAAIVNAKLFGAEPTAPPARQPVVERKVQVPSRLNVKLIGIVATEHNERSVAILLEGGAQRAYGVGDSLLSTPKANLASIEQDRVVLEVNGQLQYLLLDKEAVQSAGVTPQRSTEKAESPLPDRLDLSQPAIRAQLGDLRTKLVTDPLSLGRFVQLSPRAEDGRLVGYQLFPGRDGRLFRQLGMQAGDLVTHVEGVDVSDPANLPQLLGLVQSQQRLRINVRRGEVSQEVDVDF